MNFETLDADKVMILPKHYTKGRGSKKVEFIGIHYNAGNLTTEGCYNVWLTREASAHYQVEDDGVVGQLVWDRDTAWALGNFNANQRSINIEHANRSDGTITDACLDSGAHLVAALCIDNGLGRPEWLVNVFPHKYFMSTSCPGQIYGSQKQAYIERAQYWYDQMTAPAPEPEPEKPEVPLPDALKGYTDLDPEAWYIPTLDAAVQKGYIRGYSDTVMGPNDILKRGQAVCMIANAADAEFEHPFDDVTASPYYYDAVLWAKENEIVSGNDGDFYPDDPCTRQDFCVMLGRWRGTETDISEDKFKDWDEVADYAKPYLAWCIEDGVVSGNDGYLRPADPCTRAEAATMIVNLMKED